MLEKPQKNKMMSKEDKPVKTKNIGPLKPYLFPNHGVTVQARSLEEAEEKLLEILKIK